MQQPKQSITINARKFDGSVHRSWRVELIEQKESLLLFLGEFEKEVTHADLGVIRRGTLSYEYYWLDRWFNVFRFHEPEGELRCFYCNINLPPKYENFVLDYVDLDIDVLVWSDFNYKVLDIEEFERHTEVYRYPKTLILKIRQTLKQVQEMIKRREFPFSDHATISFKNRV